MATLEVAEQGLSLWPLSRRRGRTMSLSISKESQSVTKNGVRVLALIAGDYSADEGRRMR